MKRELAQKIEEAILLLSDQESRKNKKLFPKTKKLKVQLEKVKALIKAQERSKYAKVSI